MRLWRQRQRARQGPAIRDPFAVVPLRPAGVDVRGDSRGMTHLRRREALTGLRARVAGWLGHDYSRKFELDEYGTFFYGLVDGRHTLRDIADRMAERFERPRREAEEAVVLFTKKLMTLHMVELSVPAAAGEGSR
jgi:hypothetical protein